MTDLVESAKAAVGRYAQAAVGMFGIGGVAATSLAVSNPKIDLGTKVLGATATFFAFLVHRNLSMKDVKRVVETAVAEAIFKLAKELKEDVEIALTEHEKHCSWVVRPSKTNPPSGGD